MRTRLKTRQAQEDAVQSVLSSPDLVALILERLPVPRLSFDTYSRKVDNSDRWAASQVNTVFRRAALRLPWEGVWGPQYIHDSTTSFEALTFLRSRSVQTWQICFGPWAKDMQLEQQLRTSAAVLNYAHGTENLSLSTDYESSLLEWLHHTFAPLFEAGGGSSQGLPVLTHLASLSRLTSLQVSCEHWTDASWLTLISRLKDLDLGGYCGPPLAGLCALESLGLVSSLPRGPPDQWALPGLKTLRLKFDASVLELQQPSATGFKASDWLSRLQRLELDMYLASTSERGLKEIVPGLTYLKVSWWPTAYQIEKVLLLSKGLPVGLKALHIELLNSLWPVVFELQDLVSLEVWQDESAPVVVAGVATGLMRLPRLRHVSLHLRTGAGRASLDEGFRALDALLLQRQGRLLLSLEQ